MFTLWCGMEATIVGWLERVLSKMVSEIVVVFQEICPSEVF
jgi:hypothetical protein